MSQIIRSKYIADEYKPELLSKIVNVLAEPEGCLILVSSKSFDTSTLPIHEKWYKFDYSCDKMDEVRLNELRAA